MKKLVSYIMVFVMLFSAASVGDVFGGIIPVKASAEIPAVGTMLYSDDFSGSLLDSRISVKTGGKDSVSLKSGEMEISRQSTESSWTGADIYLNADKSAVTDGEFVTQFKLRRYSSKPTVNVRMRSSDNGDYTGFTWGNGGSVESALYYSDASDTADGGAKATTLLGSETVLLVTVYYNPGKRTFSMWLGDTLVIDNKYARHAKATDLTYIRIYTEYKGAKFYVDDFKYYSLEKITDEEKVQRDYDGLTYEDIFSGSLSESGVIKCDINLPAAGANGSAISWVSSDATLITKEGYVSPADDSYAGNPEVVLSAVIASGEYSMTKDFTVKVMKESEFLNDKHAVESVIYSNKFSEDIAESEHFVLSEDGGSIKAENDKLYIVREKNENTTIADIYPDAEHSPITGLIGVSYTVRKKGSGTSQQRFRQGGSNDFLALTWKDDNSVVCMAADVKGGEVKNYSCGTYNNELRVYAVFNTLKGVFSLWLNDSPVLENKYARVSPGDKLTYLRIYLEGGNLIATMVDDVRFFNATMRDSDIVDYDLAWLTADKLLTKPFVRDNVIDSDLNLVTHGENGSTISWESSDPAHISAETGKITRPVDAAELPEVTLTATVRSGDAIEVKKFTFKVQTTFSDIRTMLETEMSHVTPQSLMSQDDTNPDELKRSLNLPEKGFAGADISWISSNESVITNGGRVIRPRNDREAEEVTLTAVFTFDGISTSKEFHFTVLPDGDWVDPNHMTDEEFYGKWEDDAWTVTGKLNYTRDDLAAVEAAVKAGDYAKAKEELLKHMRIRTPPSHFTLGARESGYANMAIADVHTLIHATYYQGNTSIDSDDYQAYYIPIKTGQIAKGGSTTYAIAAKYNEATEALIASTRHSNPQYRPKIELTVNGSTVIRDAELSVNIRAGDYKNTNYSDGEELTVKMFGEFLGDETYKAMLKFDFGDLSDSDNVTEARLILHGRLKQSFADSKELLVLYDPNTFDESFTWNSFIGYVYNFNGLAGGSKWIRPEGSDVEYYYQAPRFARWRTVAAEYVYTEDEKYPYYMINTMMDFISERGGRTNGGQGWPSDKVIMAGHPRTLDTAERMTQWTNCMTYLVKSEYMNPEVCTAILKTIWHMTNSLTYSTLSTGNWMQIEKGAIVDVALAMPEFTASEVWLEDAVEKYEKLFTVTNTNPDGSYIEKTAGYSQNALSGFIDFKAKLMGGGKDVSAQYNDLLLKSAYYNLQLYGPSGLKIQWGDDQAGRRTSGTYSELVKWFGDKELEYISTFGAKGEKPGWTSKQYPDGRITFMRSDWTKNALYMFTQVRGSGQHGHQDDNGVIVMAYDRILIPDSGIFTYTSSDPDRKYGLSTRAHNTVEINNTTQTPESKGTLDAWVSNDSYDFLSQTSLSYSTTPHKRSVMFVKPDLWIVSDLMTPKDSEKKNIYKQLWHMLPNAGLSTDSETGLISSNFASGANIVIGTADDATVNEAMGKYDYNYQQVTDAKYAYYEKNAAGKVTFDTVLLPTRTGKAELNVERIEMGVPTSDATAIKFDTVVEGKKNTYYYMLDYTHKSGSERTFGKYVTDAEAALVCENSKGETERVILKDGSYIKTADDGRIAEFESAIADISIEQTGSKLYIETSAESVEDVIIGLKGVKYVYVNEQAVIFNKASDGSIVITSEETTVTPSTDSSSNRGGIGDRKSSGGSGSASGGSGSIVIPPVSSYDIALPFDDIENHWAEEYIICLYNGGIVKGDGNRLFRPDNQITRAEFLAMVLRVNKIAQSEYQGTFEDVNTSDWYSGAVQAALDNNIISADTAFRPNDSITREEMCKILVNAAGEKLTQPRDDFELSFGDNDKISPWALEFVKKASSNGLVNGKDNGCFEPKNNAARSEAAAVIARYLEI